MLAAISGRPRRWRRMLVLAAAGVLVAGGGLLAWWTSRPPAFHEPAGVSVLVREIAHAVPASLREHGVPGASVAVVRHGEVRWTGAYGVADARTRTASIGRGRDIFRGADGMNDQRGPTHSKPPPGRSPEVLRAAHSQ